MTEEDSTSSVVSTSGAALPSTSLSNSTMYHLRLPAEEVVRIATVMAGLVHPTNTLLSASKNPLMFPGASFGIASSNSTVTSTLSMSSNSNASSGDQTTIPSSVVSSSSSGIVYYVGYVTRRCAA